MSDNEPVFDWAQASSLLGDNPNEVDPDMAGIVLDLVQDADVQFAQLKALNPETDRKAIGAQAHGLRGCLLNFGFTEAGGILLEVEKGPYESADYLGKINKAESVFLASKKMLGERYPALKL